jgi:small-conductance mechanosensitive channel
MPSVAHLIFGGICGLFLYFLAINDLRKLMCLFCIMNNYIGPDIGWALLIGDFTHSILGMSVFAFILAFFYSYFSRFTPDFKNKILVEHEYNRVPYMNTYL